MTAWSTLYLAFQRGPPLFKGQLPFNLFYFLLIKKIQTQISCSILFAKIPFKGHQAFMGMSRYIILAILFVISYFQHQQSSTMLSISYSLLTLFHPPRTNLNILKIFLTDKAMNNHVQFGQHLPVRNRCLTDICLSSISVSHKKFGQEHFPHLPSLPGRSTKPQSALYHRRSNLYGLLLSSF